MFEVFIPITVSAAATAMAQQNSAAAFFINGILYKENIMNSTLIQELEGSEVIVDVFQDIPVKCKLIGQDENFIKVEKIDRKMSRSIMLINKNLITSIKINK